MRANFEPESCVKKVLDCVQGCRWKIYIILWIRTSSWADIIYIFNLVDIEAVIVIK